MRVHEFKSAIHLLQKALGLACIVPRRSHSFDERQLVCDALRRVGDVPIGQGEVLFL
jgi:hypothetical protein